MDIRFERPLDMGGVGCGILQGDGMAQSGVGFQGPNGLRSAYQAPLIKSELRGAVPAHRPNGRLSRSHS